jgi:hypothetical protein
MMDPRVKLAGDGVSPDSGSTRACFKRPNPHSTHGARDMTIL